MSINYKQVGKPGGFFPLSATILNFSKIPILCPHRSKGDRAERFKSRCGTVAEERGNFLLPFSTEGICATMQGNIILNPDRVRSLIITFIRRISNFASIQFCSRINVERLRTSCLS